MTLWDSYFIFFPLELLMCNSRDVCLWQGRLPRSKLPSRQGSPRAFFHKFYSNLTPSTSINNSTLLSIPLLRCWIARLFGVVLCSTRTNSGELLSSLHLAGIERLCRTCGATESKPTTWRRSSIERLTLVSTTRCREVWHPDKRVYIHGFYPGLTGNVRLTYLS